MGQFKRVLFFLSIVILSQGFGDTSLDFSQARDVRLPLFDAATGHRWGILSFRSLEQIPREIGPFYLDRLNEASLSHLTLTFDFWPQSGRSNSWLQSLAIWRERIPDSLPSLRFECKGRWALQMHVLEIHRYGNTGDSTDLGGESFGIRAGHVTVIEPEDIHEFSNVKLTYNADQNEIRIKTLGDGIYALEIPLPPEE